MKKTRFGKAFAEARASGDRFFKFGKGEYNAGLKGESGKQTVKALEKNYEKATGVPRQVASMKSLEANRSETALMPSRGVTPIKLDYGKRKGLGGLVDQIRYNRMKRAERRAEGKPEVPGVNPTKVNTATPKKEPVFVTAMANIKAGEDERQSRKPGLIGRMIENAKARRANRLAERAKREDAKASGVKLPKVTENTGDFIRGMGKGNATDMLRQAIANRANAKPTAGPTKEGPSATRAVAEANAASNQKPAETKSSPASNFVTGAGPGNARTALQQQLSTAVSTESLQDKAKRVMRGEYGVGADRKAKLGSDYEAVQSEVNKMMKSKNTFMGGGMMKKYARGGEVKKVNGMSVSPAAYERIIKDRLKAPSRKPAVDNTRVSRNKKDSPVDTKFLKETGDGNRLRPLPFKPIAKGEPRKRRSPAGMTPYNPGKKQSPKVEAKNDSTSNLDTYGSIRKNYLSGREKKETTNFSYMKGGSLKGLIGKKEGMNPKGKMDKKKAFLEMIARLKAKKK